MNLLGWNVLPDDCVAEFNFDDGPSWLKALALTPYFDRFAYPIAVRRGLGVLWGTTFSQSQREMLGSSGWILHTREKTKEEMFFEGSLALVTTGSKRRKRRHIAFTRWGRERSSRNYVHKSNGTYSHLKNRTLPSGL
ncbi:MAG: hypothetical protein Q8L08_01810 [Candidatus Nanopelagicaceae bacterium]|nr:hypothetical protein [Candidatus Nanopelagicaceae bacterium]